MSIDKQELIARHEHPREARQRGPIDLVARHAILI
jgi:hypothetical protein